MRDFDLIHILSSLYRHRIFIIIFVILVSIGAVVFSLVTPKKWTSTAVIEVESSSMGGLSSSFSGILGSFASNISGLSSSEEIYKVVFLLSSREFSEKIIQEFNLLEYFEIDDPDPYVEMDIALKNMKKIRTISLDNETNFYIISIKTKDKQMSVDIAKRYVELLEHYNTEERATKGKNLKSFLEKRILQVNNDIDELIKKTNQFQENNNVIKLDEQAKAIINNYAELIAKKDLLAIQKDFTKTNYGVDNPIYNDLTKQVELLEEKISFMESKNDSPVDKYLLPLDKISSLGVENAKFEIELMIKQQILETIYPQYEMAVLSELNDTPTLNYIQRPRIAGLRAEPKRAMICIISFLIASIISSLLVIIYDLTLNNKEFVKRLSSITQNK